MTDATVEQDVRSLVRRVYELEAMGASVTSMTAVCGEMMRVGAIIRGARRESSAGELGWWFGLIEKTISPVSLLTLDLLYAAPESGRKKPALKKLGRHIWFRHPSIPRAVLRATLRWRGGLTPEKPDAEALAADHGVSVSTVCRWRSLVTKYLRVSEAAAMARLDRALLMRGA